MQLSFTKKRVAIRVTLSTWLGASRRRSTGLIALFEVWAQILRHGFCKKKLLEVLHEDSRPSVCANKNGSPDYPMRH